MYLEQNAPSFGLKGSVGCAWWATGVGIGLEWFTALAIRVVAHGKVTGN